MKPRRLAIVPARGGSKRIPRKNIKHFHGKPIIVRVLDEISSSGLFDEIHVSTEDEEIREIVAVAGYQPRFERTQQLSGDYIPLSDVLKSVISQYKELGESFDTITMVFATAVMLDRGTLRDAINKYEDGDTSIQMISVARYPVPIEWAMRMDKSGMLDPVDRENLSMRSQDLKDAWYETADFVFYSEECIYSNDVNSLRRGFELPYMSVDIDTEDDWRKAEVLFGLRNTDAA